MNKKILLTLFAISLQFFACTANNELKLIKNIDELTKTDEIFKVYSKTLKYGNFYLKFPVYIDESGTEYVVNDDSAEKQIKDILNVDKVNYNIVYAGKGIQKDYGINKDQLESDNIIHLVIK